MKKIKEPSAKVLDKIRLIGSKNKEQSLAGLSYFAAAMEDVLRKGMLSGDITGDIFEVIKLEENATAEFPLDFIAPGTEDDFVAFTIPNHGYIPERNVEGDYVMLPIYDIGAAIDFNRKFARDARYDVAGRAMEVMQAQFTKKINDDAWHTIISAGYDRGLTVIDSDGAVGTLSKRLISLGKVIMRRNGGGNSTSLNRGKLTDMYLSPEGMEDMRNWNVDEVDEITRREIYLAEDGTINRVFSVNLHDLDELGEGQEYQLYLTTTLGGTLPGSKVELAVGLDLSRRDSFVMPVREYPRIEADDTLKRQRRVGWFGDASLGVGCLDGRRVMFMAY